MGDSDKQYIGRLIEEYYYNLRIRKLAESEGASKTLEEINNRLKMLKLQLQPLELPDE